MFCKHHGVSGFMAGHMVGPYSRKKALSRGNNGEKGGPMVARIVHVNNDP